MGFTFNFFGIPYSQCVIGANGTIGFDTSLSGGYDPWPISAALLGNPSKYNSICGPWCDMDMFFTGPTADGEITYFTYGTAPNRQFVVNYCHNSMYECPAQHTTSQMILYESTNVIEVHIAHKDTCAWNNGYAIVGVQSDSAMATAVTAPGRDFPSVWAASNEAWQFTPTSGGTSYTVASIPYATVPYYTIYWIDSATGTFLGSGDSIVLSPDSVTYLALGISCSDSMATGLDTVARGYLRVSSITGTTGLSPVVPIQNILLYPNPATNELNVSADATMTEIIVCNLLGQEVLIAKPNLSHVVLNTSVLPTGVYLLKINGTVMRKFVRE